MEDILLWCKQFACGFLELFITEVLWLMYWWDWEEVLWLLNVKFGNHIKTEIEQLTTPKPICTPEQDHLTHSFKTLVLGWAICCVPWDTLERGVSGPYTPPAFLHVTWSIRPICKVFSGSLPVTLLYDASFMEMWPFSQKATHINH